jgi:hypothetical protein
MIAFCELGCHEYGAFFAIKEKDGDLVGVLGGRLEILQFRKLHTEPFRRNTVSLN